LAQGCANARRVRAFENIVIPESAERLSGTRFSKARCKWARMAHRAYFCRSGFSHHGRGEAPLLHALCDVELSLSERRLAAKLKTLNI